MKPSSTIYRGQRCADADGTPRVRVTVDGVDLTPTRARRLLDLAGGFEFGYRGAGPSLLALALLLDALGSETLARDAYLWFRSDVVANFGAEWELTAGAVGEWAYQFEREQHAEAVAEAMAEAALAGVEWEPSARVADDSATVWMFCSIPGADADLEGGGV